MENVYQKMQEAVLATSYASGMTVENIIGGRRTQNNVTPRHVASWIMRVYMGQKYVDIADFMKRDHSTIIYSVKKVGDMVRIGDKEYTGMLEKSISNWINMQNLTRAD